MAERRYIPLSRLRARPTPDLPDFAVGPSMDYTGQPVDQMEHANAQAGMQRELDAFAQMQNPPRSEAADVEHAQLRQQDIIAQLEELMAQQRVHAEDVYGRERADDALSLASMPELPNAQTIHDMRQPGNIDLHNRPVVPNGKGFSTVMSMGISEDGREIVIPRVSDDGRIMSPQEAVDMYHRTGRHLGKFSTRMAAEQYAQQLHQDQEKEYAPRAITSQPQPKQVALAQQVSQPVSLDTLSFGTAFRAARAAGRKVFTWRGRSYNTQLSPGRQ